MSGGQRHRTGKHPQQGRLSGSVDAHQANALARGQAPGQIAHQFLTGGCRHRRVLKFDDDTAQAATRKCAQRHRVSRRRHIGDQGLGRLDPVSGLGRTRGWTAPQPGQLLACEIAAARLRGVGLPPPFGTGERPVGITAFIRFDAAVDNLPGAGGHGVQKPPIVGHDHQRGAPRQQMLGEPLDAFDVQVVRRLVENEQVQIAYKCGGEPHAPPLASGQLIHASIQAEGRYSKPFED